MDFCARLFEVVRWGRRRCLFRWFRLRFLHLHGRLLLLRRRELLPDGFCQGVLSGIGHRSVSLIRNRVRLSESNAPLEEQLQLHLHGVGPGFHHNELAFGHGLQLVWGHERPLNHLQGLGAAVLALADRSALHGPAAQGFAHHLGGFAVGSKATEDGDLGVVHDDLRPLFAVVFLQLSQALDNGDDGEPPGPAGGEHHLGGLDLWQGAKLVAVEHCPVGKLPTVVIGYRQDLPVQLLDDQRDHEELRGIFFRHHQKQC